MIIELKIKELVIHGLEPGQRHRAADALENELGVLSQNKVCLLFCAMKVQWRALTWGHLIFLLVPIPGRWAFMQPGQSTKGWIEGKMYEF